MMPFASKPGYEYRFVRLRVKKNALAPEYEYRSIVEDYASRGWRLVQIFAPPIGAGGTALYFELIFERDLSASV